MIRKIAVLTSIIMIMIGAFTINSLDTYAAEEKEVSDL